MNLQKKDEITETLIINNPDFNSHDVYVKGYFSEVDIIFNNEYFLELYRYVQYWRLPIKNGLISYAEMPNYASESLLKNMLLTGDDKYYKYLSNIIINAEYKPSKIEIDREHEDIYDYLVKINRADLVLEYYMSGIPFTDLHPTIQNINVSMEVLKIMLDNNYEPSDEIIMWYIDNGYGKLAIMCIEDHIDKDFFLDEIPTCLDFFNEILKCKYNNKINDIQVENIMNKLLTRKMSNNDIDVVLFITLYRLCSDKMSSEYKKVLLSIVVNLNQQFLTLTFLREIDNEINHCNVMRTSINNLLINSVKNKYAYIIFNIEILNYKNYTSILDIGEDMEHDTLDDKIIYNTNNDDQSSSSSDSDCYSEYDSDSDCYSECDFNVENYGIDTLLDKINSVDIEI